MVWFTSAATHDHALLKKLSPDDNTIYVFDKGYNDYKAFKLFGKKGAGFVTRIKDDAVYKVEQELHVEECIHSGVLEDTIIEVTVKEDDGQGKLMLRKVVFYDRVLKRKFESVSYTHLKDKLDTVTQIGMDETSRKKGHNYVTIFADLDQRRVIHVCEGKDASTVEDFTKALAVSYTHLTSCRKACAGTVYAGCQLDSRRAGRYCSCYSL